MSEYYGNNDWRDYLALQHHGILGMKWGHRNGPPYPLGSSDHSASEKKAGWRKSLSGGSGGTVKKKKVSSSSPAREEVKKLNKDMVLYGLTGTVIKRRMDTKRTGNDTRVSTTIRNYQKEKAKKLGDKEALKELNEIEKAVKERDAKKAANKEKAVKERDAKKVAKEETKQAKKRAKEEARLGSDVRSEWVNSYNRAVELFNSRIGALNDKFDDPNIDYEKDKKYGEAVSKLWKECYKKSIIERYGDRAKSLNLYDDVLETAEYLPFYSMIDDMYDLK